MILFILCYPVYFYSNSLIKNSTHLQIYNSISFQPIPFYNNFHALGKYLMLVVKVSESPYIYFLKWNYAKFVCKT